MIFMQRRSFNHRLLSLIASLAGLTHLPPAWAKETTSKVAVNKEIATKDTVLLAKTASAGIDPEGYLISEKLDGVRAVWDGKVLRFRSGRVIAAPAWFTDKLPKVALDGELWLGRGQFDALSGFVRKTKPVDADWQQISYMVFELPKDSSKFVERVVKLKSIVQTADFSQLQAVEHYRIANNATLQAKLDDIVQDGGEGLMLHWADSLVTVGRSDVLLKLKPVQDAEALVTGYVAGKGKYKGMTGALKVLTASGQSFNIGTGLSDELRQSPPAIGSTITYKYRDLTPTGVPRFASFYRIHEGF